MLSAIELVEPATPTTPACRVKPAGSLVSDDAPSSPVAVSERPSSALVDVPFATNTGVLSVPFEMLVVAIVALFVSVCMFVGAAATPAGATAAAAAAAAPPAAAASNDRRVRSLVSSASV